MLGGFSLISTVHIRYENIFLLWWLIITVNLYSFSVYSITLQPLFVNLISLNHEYWIFLAHWIFFQDCFSYVVFFSFWWQKRWLRIGGGCCAVHLMFLFLTQKQFWHRYIIILHLLKLLYRFRCIHLLRKLK